MARFVAHAWAFAVKELRHLARDRRSQALTVALPMVALSAFAFSFGGVDLAAPDRAEAYPLAVMDRDGSAESRWLVEAIADARLFTLHGLDPRLDPAEYARTHEVFAVLVVPEGFGERVASGSARLRFVEDNSRPYVGALTLGRLKLVLEAVAREGGRGVEIESAPLVPGAGGLEAFMPAIMVLLVTFTSLHDVSTSFAREQSERAINRVWTSPTSKGALVLGKALAALLVVLARTAVIAGFAALALGVTVRGSVVAFVAVMLLAGLATIAIGVAVASRARTDREALVATLMVTLVLMFMMGVVTPLDLMDDPARALTGIVPHAHATEALRRVVLLGDGLGAVLPALLFLLASGLAVLAAGTLAFRRGGT